MISKFVSLLRQADIHISEQELMDALWLATKVLPEENSPELNLAEDDIALSIETEYPFFVDRSVFPTLKNSLAIARALRPLKKRVPSKTGFILDEEQTATQSAINSSLMPVYKPKLTPWLDLALVIEDSNSTLMWKPVIDEFQSLLTHLGAFNTVNIWRIGLTPNENIRLFPKSNKFKNSYNPHKLIDPEGRLLVLLVSDCLSPLWRNKDFYFFLKNLSSTQPISLVQLLPERLWSRTALGGGFPVQFKASAPGVANSRLAGLPVWKKLDELRIGKTLDAVKILKLPVVTLHPDSISQWSQMISGIPGSSAVGIVFDLSYIESNVDNKINLNRLSPEELVQKFWSIASLPAQRLAGLLAVVPVSLPVIHLLQAKLLPESKLSHVAEVFMSDLLYPIAPENFNSDMVQYDFVEGVRNILLGATPIDTIDEVLEVVSQYIAAKACLSIRSFADLLTYNEPSISELVVPFCQVTNQVLKRLGGDYAELAETLEQTNE